MSDFRALRIGRISSVDRRSGTARVTYEDHGSSTTSELPFLSWIYRMPQIGQFVLVGHLSNGSGSSSAVILGPIWTDENSPIRFAADEYHQELGREYGESFISYLNGILELHAQDILFSDQDGDLATIKEMLDKITDLEEQIGTISGDSQTILEYAEQIRENTEARHTHANKPTLDTLAPMTNAEIEALIHL